MPLIDPLVLESVNEPLMHGYVIGTIATDISSKERDNSNITKVKINWNKTQSVGESIDFYKESNKQVENIYQHVGIYSFKPDAHNFVSMQPSNNEITKKLEQLRALDAGIKIGITYVENIPISVDALEDLMLIEKIIKNNNEEIKNFAFQGVNGAYSEQAGKNVFPNATSVPCATFEEMFACVRDAKADIALVPIENSQAEELQIHKG